MTLMVLWSRFQLIFTFITWSTSSPYNVYKLLKNRSLAFKLSDYIKLDIFFDRETAAFIHLWPVWPSILKNLSVLSMVKIYYHLTSMTKDNCLWTSVKSTVWINMNRAYIVLMGAFGQGWVFNSLQNVSFFMVMGSNRAMDLSLTMSTLAMNNQALCSANITALLFESMRLYSSKQKQD